MLGVGAARSASERSSLKPARNAELRQQARRGLEIGIVVHDRPNLEFLRVSVRECRSDRSRSTLPWLNPSASMQTRAAFRSVPTSSITW